MMSELKVFGQTFCSSGVKHTYPAALTKLLRSLPLIVDTHFHFNKHVEDKSSPSIYIP